jgi:hypothetical protein
MHTKRLLLFGAILFLAIFLVMPIQASRVGREPEPPGMSMAEWRERFICLGDVDYKGPKFLATYLWRWNRQDMLTRFPQTSKDQNNDVDSPTLIALFEQHVDLAAQLSQEYKIGWEGPHVVNASTGTMGITIPYGNFWTPAFFSGMIGGLMQNGANITDALNCLQHEYGFQDQDFLKAAFSTMNAGTGIFYDCVTSYPDQEGHWPMGGPSRTCLDPAVYGKHPYLIKVDEFTYTLDSNGHITFTQPSGYPLQVVPEDESYCQRFAAAGETCFRENLRLTYTLDKYLGNPTFIIIPEAVYKALDNPHIPAIVSAYLTYLGGASAPDTINGQQFQQAQDAYQQLEKALDDYGKQMKYDFTSFTRIPYDTRLPDFLKKDVLWASWPSPMQEWANALLNPKQCTWNNCVLDGRSMAQHYAERIYSFLSQASLFVGQIRLTYYLTWLKNYISQDRIDKLPKARIENTTQMDYHVAIQIYHSLTVGGVPTSGKTNNNVPIQTPSPAAITKLATKSNTTVVTVTTTITKNSNQTQPQPTNNAVEASFGPLPQKPDNSNPILSSIIPLAVIGIPMNAFIVQRRRRARKVAAVRSLYPQIMSTGIKRAAPLETTIKRLEAISQAERSVS